MRRPAVRALALVSVLLVVVATAPAVMASAAPARVLIDSYVVAAEDRDLALSVEDNSHEEGARAVLAPLEHLGEQQWTQGENDITELENLATGKCLRFARPSGFPENPVVQVECVHDDAQTWYYVAADDHFETWRYENVASGTCLAVLDLAPGAPVIEADCDEDDPRQRWTAFEVED